MHLLLLLLLKWKALSEADVSLSVRLSVPCP